MNQISFDQLALALKKVNLTDKVVISMGKIKLVDKDHAECVHCHKIIAINELNGQEYEKVVETGLCSTCQNVLKQAATIQQCISSVSTSMPTVSNESIQTGSSIQAGLPIQALKASQSSVTASAGQQCRTILFEALPNMTQNHVQMFCDPMISKELLGLLYPLFVKVTGFNKEQLNLARKPRGFNRYMITKYHIFDDDYLICNDLYDRHVAKFKNTFIDLGLISGSKMPELPTRKRGKQMPIDPIFNPTEDLDDKTTKEKQNKILSVVDFSNNTMPKAAATRKKKSKQEILADVEKIELDAAESKKLRLENLKKKFGINFRNNKKANNNNSNDTVILTDKSFFS